METIFPCLLENRFVRLEPLSLDHVHALVAAASLDRSTYGFTGVPDGAPAMERYIRQALEQAAQGMAVPFATVDAVQGRVVGSTRFGAVERWTWPLPHASQHTGWPDAVEIGWTWLAGDVQRTSVNTAAKLLMLGHAFETWKVKRVTLKTDERNRRSRANIERIGGRLDGIMRAHMPAFDGGIRNSAVYSLLPEEWPANKARLQAALERVRDGR